MLKSRQIIFLIVEICLTEKKKTSWIAFIRSYATGHNNNWRNGLADDEDAAATSSATTFAVFCSFSFFLFLLLHCPLVLQRELCFVR